MNVPLLNFLPTTEYLPELPDSTIHWRLISFSFKHHRISLVIKIVDGEFSLVEFLFSNLQHEVVVHTKQIIEFVFNTNLMLQ